MRAARQMCLRAPTRDAGGTAAARAPHARIAAYPSTLTDTHSLSAPNVGTLGGRACRHRPRGILRCRRALDDPWRRLRVRSERRASHIAHAVHRGHKRILSARPTRATRAKQCRCVSLCGLRCAASPSVRGPNAGRICAKTPFGPRGTGTRPATLLSAPMRSENAPTHVRRCSGFPRKRARFGALVRFWPRDGWMRQAFARERFLGANGDDNDRQRGRNCAQFSFAGRGAPRAAARHAAAENMGTDASIPSGKQPLVRPVRPASRARPTHPSSPRAASGATGATPSAVRTPIIQSDTGSPTATCALPGTPALPVGLRCETARAHAAHGPLYACPRQQQKTSIIGQRAISSAAAAVGGQHPFVARRRHRSCVPRPVVWPMRSPCDPDTLSGRGSGGANAGAV